jgi:hypothetical protein
MPTGSSGRRRTSFIGRLFAGRAHRGLGLVLGAVLTLGVLGVAVAETLKGSTNQIVEYGPEDPVTGYPTWYRDAGFTHAGTYHDSVDLEPCLGDEDPMCLPAPAPDPSRPLDLKTGNFPDEFFYYHFEAAGLRSNGGRDVLMEAALEGAWSAEEVRDGDQTVFGRVRIRVEGLRAGSEYTVTHPQGADRFVATADRRGINYTQDITPVPKRFDAAFGSRVGPFLRWAPNSADPNDRPPDGYIGDPNTDHKVVGSPFRTNYVRITGPAVGAPAGSRAGTNPNPCPTDPDAPGYWAGREEDCIFTDLFNVMGKLSKTGGVENHRATYSRDASGRTAFDVFSRSKGSQALVVRDGDRGGDARFGPTPLLGARGRYFAHVDIRGGDLPPEVTVANVSDDPDTVKTVPLRDLVTVTSAAYDNAAHELTVTAHSSDKLVGGDGKPVARLTLPDYGDAELVDGTATVDLDTLQPPLPRPIAPVSIRVASTGGDVATGHVLVTGPATAAVGATATGPTTAEQGSTVTLSALGSRGQIDSYAWTAPDGIALEGADTATPSFTAPTLDSANSTRDLTFKVTVSGPGGSDTAAVTVKVLAVTAPVAVIAPSGVAELGAAFAIDGTRSTGAARYAWTYQQAPGDPDIALADTTSPTLRFVYPTGVPLDPVTGDPRPLTFRLTVTNVRDESDTATIAVRAATSDALTVGKVRYVEDKHRWVVDGTAKLPAGNQVTVHAGPTLDGPVIGKATVVSVGGPAVVGTWLVDARSSPVTLGDAICRDRVEAYCVSIESSRGASALAVPVERADRLPPPSQLPEDQQPTVPQPLAAPAAAAVSPLRAPAARPMAGARLIAPLRLIVSRVVAPAIVRRSTIAGTGIRLAFTAPADATIARVRVLTTRGTPLLQTFRKVRGGAHVKVRIRSEQLRRKVRPGRRYVIEIRAGTARTRLGAATKRPLRVRP